MKSKKESRYERIGVYSIDEEYNPITTYWDAKDLIPEADMILISLDTGYVYAYRIKGKRR